MICQTIQQIMNAKLIIGLALLIFLSFSTITDDIKLLHTKLYQTYWNSDIPYKFLQTWEHKKGLFQSDIHFNIVDKKNSLKASLQRRKLKIDDQNMFVTSFVLYGLLEAEQLGTISIDHHLFSESISVLATFRDKNQAYGVPQYMFWPQQLINGVWSSNSVNLFNLIDSLPNFPPKVSQFLQKHGFGIWIYAKDVKKAFCIPADTDDSSVNIALLGYLDETNSQHYQFWKNQNFNLKRFYNNIAKYAYRPFSNQTQYPRSSEIDPRTYFIIHNFLKLKKEQALLKGTTVNVVLPTTWIMTRDEEQQDVVVMPFHLNNVDASVNANFLFGLLYQIKSNTIQLNSDLRQMMRDISDFLVYVLDNALQRRPDLILMYYPSKNDFYWFVARIVGLLERMDRTDSDVAYAYEVLSLAMRTIGTERIIHEKKQSPNGYYWVQFLGNFANKNRNQDSVYSTALVLNALLDTWGIKKNKSFTYLPDTPELVKKSVQNGVKYLQNALKAKNTDFGNAFFSGSLKVLTKDFPYTYPATKMLYKNHTIVNPQTATAYDLSEVIQYSAKGYIQDDKFQQYLKLKWFTYDVPQTFETYNEGIGMTFPFWSSPSITQIMMITAFSKYYLTLQNTNA